MVGEALVAEDNNLVSYGIQEGSIVGDDDNSCRIKRLQIALQHPSKQNLDSDIKEHACSKTMRSDTD